MQYRRISQSVLAETDDNLLVEGVVNHVLAHLGDRYPPTTEVPIEGLPKSVRTTWLLWCFSSEVAGNGLPDYLLNHCTSTEQAREFLAALREVQADTLAEMFEACIPLALAEDCELHSFAGSDWFHGFERSERWPSLDAIAEPSMELAASPLTNLVAAHLRVSASEI